MGSMTLRRLLSRRHIGSGSSSRDERMSFRSLRPLPCSMRISMRVLAMSSTLRGATSDTRSLAPEATPSAALYLVPGAASRSFYMSRFVYSVLETPSWVVGGYLVPPASTASRVPVLGQVRDMPGGERAPTALPMDPRP